MYQSAFTYRPRTVRFCQWSRKAYAAFASLKIQVTMGCVSKGITEVALSKNGYTAEKQSSLQGNTGFMPPEEASRASGTEMPPLPASFCLPETGKFILLRPLPVLDFRDLFLSFVLLYCP